MEDGRTERVRGFSRHTLAFERRSPPERSDARAPRDHSVFCDNTRQSYPITISAHRYLKQQPLDALRGGSRGGGDARVGLAARQRRERPLERGGVTLGDGQARRARQERWSGDRASAKPGDAPESAADVPARLRTATPARIAAMDIKAERGTNFL